MELPADFQRLSLVDNRQEKLDQSIIPSADGDHFSFIPTEILQIIFSFLRPKFLHQGVLPVCRRFRRILTDKKLWMRKIRNHHLKVRLCEAEVENGEFSPARTYVAMLREEKLRKNWNERKRSLPVTLDHPIESVKLFERAGGKYCISASGEYLANKNYNQYIQLWSLDVVTKGITLVHEATSRSSDNFGDLEMCGTDRFLSAAHDSTLKLWDIGESGFRELFKKKNVSINCALSVQGQTLACWKRPNIISLLNVDNGLQEIGRSAELPITGEYSFAKAVKLKGNTVYALFSNQLITLDLRNLRAGPVHRQVFELPVAPGFLQRTRRHSFTSMSVADGLIHCCHNGGEISVLQAVDLSPCYSYYVSENILEKWRLRSVVKTKGSVLALTGQAVRAFSLGAQPECIGVANYSGCEAAFDVLHEDVVLGSYNGSLTYWPTEK